MDKAYRVVSGWFGDSLFKNVSVYWTASLAVSFINYLYYPVLGRIMRPADFGEVQTIISIYTQVGVFFQVLSLVGVSVIAKYAHEEDRRRVGDELSRIAIMFSLVMLCLTVVFSVPLSRFFHFSSLAPFYVLAVALVLAVPASFANSYLQGHKQFWALSFGSLIGSVAKLLFAVAFVSLGYGAFGAVGGLVCSQVVALVYALRMGSGVRRFVAANTRLRRPNIDLIRPELVFAVVVLVTSIATNLMLSFDILVVKHYFTPTDAGLYSGISIISNIIFFVSAPIAGAMIPSIRPHDPTGRNARLLRRSLMFVLAVGGVVTLVFVAEPHLVVGLLLGSRYVPYAGYLRGLSVALFAMSIVNLLVYYQIGARNFWIAPAVGLGLIVTLGAVVGSHATMGAVVADLVFGGVFSLGVITALTLGMRITRGYV